MESDTDTDTETNESSDGDGSNDHGDDQVDPLVNGTYDAENESSGEEDSNHQSINGANGENGNNNPNNNNSNNHQSNGVGGLQIPLSLQQMWQLLPLGLHLDYDELFQSLSGDQSLPSGPAFFGWTTTEGSSSGGGSSGGDVGSEQSGPEESNGGDQQSEVAEAGTAPNEPPAQP